MSTIDELAVRARARRRQLDSLNGEAKSVLTRGKEVQTEIKELQTTIITLDKTSILLNSLGEERQLAAQSVIEELVTKGLQEIFDESLSFHISQTTKARAASVEFLVRTHLKDGLIVDTPGMDARGGGVAVTIGFLLRLVVMLLGKGAKQDNILVLDETFSHVSEEYLANLGEFLREIVDKTGIQIIMVTHQQSFSDYADTVYHFSTVDGRTVVKSV